MRSWRLQHKVEDGRDADKGRALQCGDPFHERERQHEHRPEDSHHCLPAEPFRSEWMQEIAKRDCGPSGEKK